MKYADEHTIESLVENIKEKFASKQDIGVTPIMSALYTDLYHGANSTNNGYFEPICVKPKDVNKTFGVYHIRFRMSTVANGYPNYANYSDVELWFNRTGSINCYRVWNWRVGSYLHCSVGVCYPSSNANFNTVGTHIGVGITNANNYNNANYKRNTLIEILDISDDLVVTLDAPEETKQYIKMPWYNSTNLPNHTTIDACDVGLQKTGDTDHYERLLYPASSIAISNKFRMMNNTLFGFDDEGKLFSMGQYGTSSEIGAIPIGTQKGEWSTGIAYSVGDYIHYSNDIYYRCVKAHTSSSSIIPTDTTYWKIYREYNHEGFDYKKGIKYGGSSLAKGTTKPSSNWHEVFPGVDLRYTFNCVASNFTSNTLGIELGKYVYIRGYIKNELFYIVPTTVTYKNDSYLKCWTQDIIEENILIDGIPYPVCYWLIGSAYYNSSYTTRGYQVNLFVNNPVFFVKNGKLIEYSDKQDIIYDLDTIRIGAAKGYTALQKHQDISGKQDVISDLNDIRSGASKGATSVQPSSIADMETKTHASNTYQPKGNYLTQHQDISGKANISSPSLTGTPRAPTATSADNSTQIATTQFVQQEIDRRASEFSFTVGSGNFVLAEVESLTSIL